MQGEGETRMRTIIKQEKIKRGSKKEGMKKKTKRKEEQDERRPGARAREE